MPRYRESDWYESPHYYDIVFDAGTGEECDFLERMLEQHAATRGRSVLEPACGSGRLVAEMARRGYRVTGFDGCAGALSYARERLQEGGLRARLLDRRMEHFELRERFDLAHCLVSTFKYLLSEKDARGHLECVARCLKPGGLYVVGLHLSDYDCPRPTRERWVVERGAARVVCNIQCWPPDRKTRLERVRSRLTVEEGGETRRLETNWQFRSYDARQLRRLLRSVPALEHLTTYDFTYLAENERQLDDDQMDNVLVLRKRA